MAGRALPGLAAHPEGVRLLLPGTPITFARFTRRTEGRVGGLPQTSLGAAFPPRVLQNLWLVGDSIFPGAEQRLDAPGGAAGDAGDRGGRLRGWRRRGLWGHSRRRGTKDGDPYGATRSASRSIAA